MHLRGDMPPFSRCRQQSRPQDFRDLLREFVWVKWLRNRRLKRRWGHQTLCDFVGLRCVEKGFEVIYHGVWIWLGPDNGITIFRHFFGVSHCHITTNLYPAARILFSIYLVLANTSLAPVYELCFGQPCN